VTINLLIINCYDTYSVTVIVLPSYEHFYESAPVTV